MGKETLSPPYCPTKQNKKDAHYYIVKPPKELRWIIRRFSCKKVPDTGKK